MNTALTMGDALTIASNWISNSKLPMMAGFIGGSAAQANAEAPYDPASDIDCYLVVEGDPPAGKIGKISVDGVLLDVSWISWSQLERATSDAVLASLLHFGLIVRDHGYLHARQQKISSTFHDPELIELRLENMRAKIRSGLGVDSSHLSAPEQVMNWLFPATLSTHIPLIRACVPLTVRKRFAAAKMVMTPHAYEELLSLYGFDTVTTERAQSWLDDTARLLDATTNLAEASKRFWASDITADAREIAIDGSQKLIDAGLHRESLYWIIATAARCLTVRADAGVDSEEFAVSFGEMLTTLGIRSMEDRKSRSERILSWIAS